MSKHAALREKGYNVVGWRRRRIDFRTVFHGASYSHIILNHHSMPSAEHVLKAWDI